MAIYEYVCIECDKSIKINRPINSEENIPFCEICGYKMIREWGSPPVIFKGSGFYSTDK